MISTAFTDAARKGNGNGCDEESMFNFFFCANITRMQEKHHCLTDDNPNQCPEKHAFFKNEDYNELIHLTDENPIVLFFRLLFYFSSSYDRILKKQVADSRQTTIFSHGRFLSRNAAKISDD